MKLGPGSLRLQLRIDLVSLPYTTARGFGFMTLFDYA